MAFQWYTFLLLNPVWQIVNSFSELLAIVQQDVFLFDGSVRDNIAYGRHDADAEVEDAARRANAHEFIVKLPEGCETLVGERGVKLSGGQRQRLAIARAILKSPQILILDEATSNLDTESEQLIQASMATLLTGRTTFVIAHRLSTIRRAEFPGGAALVTAIALGGDSSSSSTSSQSPLIQGPPAGMPPPPPPG